MLLSVLTNEWKHIGCGRHLLCDQHEEDSHGQQGGDAHSDLLTRVTRYVKPQQRDKCYNHAGEYHIEDIEQRLAPHLDHVSHIWVRLHAAGVIDNIPSCVKLDQEPLAVGDVVGHISVFTDFDEVHLVAIVGPRGKEEGAVLLVKWEVLDVNGARAPEDHHGKPGDVTVGGDHHIGTDGGFV